MRQTYHSNAVSNVHIRKQIKESVRSNLELSKQFGVSVNTIIKWKDRNTLTDKSSRPNRIYYALDGIETHLAVLMRKSTWLPLDEVWETLREMNPKIGRSAIYRTFCRNNINTLPEKEKQKAKRFKEYEPGFLHMDVTYFPLINGVKYYLFVAIDRATRTIYYELYDAKTSQNTDDFMRKCIDFFPFKITHVLTDNGLEFTNRLIRSKKGKLCTKPSKLDVLCDENQIDHRLIRPFTPQTNGMVERVNGTIKNGTILKETYKNKEEMNQALNVFLIHYMLYKRHGGVRKELNVKTPFMAVEKWFELKPKLFKEKPRNFKQKILSLKEDYNASFR
jgi:transposase InsO family protein